MKKTLLLLLISFVWTTSFSQIDPAKNNIHLYPYVDNTGRDVCLAWDNQTGKSFFYSWNTSIKNWKAYEINLPENPIPDAKGPIMMSPYVDKTGRDVCLAWDTKTGKSLFYSWNTSSKDWKAYEINLPENPIPDAKGQIMMSPYIDNTGRDVCLVWDTQTGKSLFYSWDTSSKNWKAYEINLPENSIPDAKGQIMMSPYVDNTRRDVCLAWDTQTGKSFFYSWNTSSKNWKAYEINIPENPIPDAKGQIMMRPYVDNTGRDVCLAWDTQTGKSLFYAWSTSSKNWKAYEINLPENPLQK